MMSDFDDAGESRLWGQETSNGKFKGFSHQFSIFRKCNYYTLCSYVFGAQPLSFNTRLVDAG